MTDHRHEWTRGGRPGCPIYDYCRSCGEQKPGPAEGESITLDLDGQSIEVALGFIPRLRRRHPRMGVMAQSSCPRPRRMTNERLVRNAALPAKRHYSVETTYARVASWNKHIGRRLR